MRQVHFRTGSHAGSWNMAFDRLLMDLVRRGEYAFVLRTYGWDPACVSIGKLQKKEREIDTARLLADGYHIVRRPTGGRAVWHETEVTYSVVAPLDHPMVCGSLSEALKKVSIPMAEAISSLGVDVRTSSMEDHRAGGPRVAGNPCFTSHGKWEIGTPDGRKLVGSAQARSRGVFLEHGSILLKNDQMKILDYAPSSTPEGFRGILEKHLREGIASLREFVPEVSFQMVEKALHEAFSAKLESGLDNESWNSLKGPKLKEIERQCMDEV